MLNLKSLSVGDKARLLSFGQTSLPYRHKLIQFGLIPGIDIQILNKAPLGCPVEILVRNTALVLRLQEASMLQWERL
jgi:ferrous iron transport protein A